MVDPSRGVISVLSSVPDCRLDRTKAHSLCSILLGTLIAVICDCDSYVEVADFMQSQFTWLIQPVYFSTSTNLTLTTGFCIM